MTTVPFYDRLEAAWRDSGSLVCVGLDPEMHLLADCVGRLDCPFLEFNREIVRATLPYTCAYKLQFAHYASVDRLEELRETISYIREHAPGRIIILDAQRGGIGSTACHYVTEAFNIYEADAVTVNPYMGGDTIKPFTGNPEKGVVVLCKTSNPSAAELQDLVLQSGDPFFIEVARKAALDWNTKNDLCLLVGAPYPGDLARIRDLVPEMPILVPGIGAQGGDLEATLQAGLRKDGKGLLLNSSRSILYASSGDDFAKSAGEAAASLKAACNQIRASLGFGQG